MRLERRDAELRLNEIRLQIIEDRKLLGQWEVEVAKRGINKLQTVSSGTTGRSGYSGISGTSGYSGYSGYSSVRSDDK